MSAEEVINKLKFLLRPPDGTEDVYYNSGVIDAINTVEKLSHKSS